MGTYLYAYCEKRVNGEWQACTVQNRASKMRYSFQIWDFQNYTVFGWLANVRNDAQIPPLSEKRGFPEGVSKEIQTIYDNLEWGPYPSWVSLKELTEFDYEQEFENHRDNKVKNVMKIKDIFGQVWWTDLFAMMKEVYNPEDIRIVFWFD